MTERCSPTSPLIAVPWQTASPDSLPTDGSTWFEGGALPNPPPHSRLLHEPVAHVPRLILRDQVRTHSVARLSPSTSCGMIPAFPSAECRRLPGLHCETGPANPTGIPMMWVELLTPNPHAIPNVRFRICTQVSLSLNDLSRRHYTGATPHVFQDIGQQDRETHGVWIPPVKCMDAAEAITGRCLALANIGCGILGCVGDG